MFHSRVKGSIGLTDEHRDQLIILSPKDYWRQIAQVAVDNPVLRGGHRLNLTASSGSLKLEKEKIKKQEKGGGNENTKL